MAKEPSVLHPILRQYMILTEFLGKVLGPQYEITLHDLSSQKQSVAAIVNGHISGRTEGAPLTDLALRFVKDRVYEEMDYRTGYWGVSQNKAPLRSSTMFIKDENGQLIGMLCINRDVGQCLELMDQLSRLMQLDLPALGQGGSAGIPHLHPSHDPSQDSGQDNIETFSNSLSDLVASALDKVLSDPAIPKERLTQEEKMEVVDALNQKGVFLLKGAVSEVAGQLHSSEASIYRYISKLNKITR